MAKHGDFGTLPRAQAGDRPDVIVLLPCPFCGNRVEVEVARDARWVTGHFYVACGECGARAGKRDDHAGAIEAWQRRV
jgi:Lar family restriction alleviation protein